MAQFVEVPVAQLSAEVLQALLEEFASRDGTDYGERESSLAARVTQLRSGLAAQRMSLVYDSDSEHWDILPADVAASLLLAGQNSD